MAMVNNHLLGEFNGNIKMIMSRSRLITDAEILNYVQVILHKYLNMDDTTDVMNNYGMIRNRFRLTKGEDDPNGLFKIHKITYGYLGGIASERLVARFWIDEHDTYLTPEQFLEPIKAIDRTPNVVTAE